LANTAQAFTGLEPSAMFTPTINSSMSTSPLALQSPAHDAAARAAKTIEPHSNDMMTAQRNRPLAQERTVIRTRSPPVRLVSFAQLVPTLLHSAIDRHQHRQPERLHDNPQVVREMAQSLRDVSGISTAFAAAEEFPP